jgi:hypothetical protein
MSLTSEPVPMKKLRVVVVHPGCWCEGEHGFVLARRSEYDPPRYTVQLDNGSRFLAEPGDLARESPARSAAA